MKKTLIPILVLSITFAAFSILLWNLLYVSFTPTLNGIVKRNYGLISVLCSLVYLVFVFKKKSIKRPVKIIFTLGVIFILTGAFARSMFYTGFHQKVINKLGRDVYLILTYNPSFGICKNQYSIVKENLFFVKQVYNIGCYEYKIQRLSKDEVTIVRAQKPLVEWKEIKYDTIILKL